MTIRGQGENAVLEVDVKHSKQGGPVTLVLLALAGSSCADDAGDPSDGRTVDASAATRHEDASDIDDEGEPEDASSDEDASTSIGSDSGPRAEDAGALAPVDAAQLPPRKDVDTDTKRMDSVATEFCKVAFGCNAKDARDVFGSETRCRTDMRKIFDNSLELDGSDCADSQLDLHNCYVAATCDDQFTACVSGEDETAALCPQSF